MVSGAWCQCERADDSGSSGSGKELAGADPFREHRLHSFQDDDRAWRKGGTIVVLM